MTVSLNVSTVVDQLMFCAPARKRQKSHVALLCSMAEGTNFSLSPSKVQKAREAIDFLSSLSEPGPSGSSSGSGPSGSSSGSSSFVSSGNNKGTRSRWLFLWCSIYKYASALCG